MYVFSDICFKVQARCDCSFVALNLFALNYRDVLAFLNVAFLGTRRIIANF